MSSILEEGPREKYEATKDPACIWELIDFLAPAYASGRREFPDWVRSYICECAANIMKLDRTGKKYPLEIYKALGKPLQSTISQSIKRERDDFISSLIQEEFAKGIKPLGECCELIADKLNLGVQNVTAIHRAYRKRVDEEKKDNEVTRERDDNLSSLIQLEISQGKPLEECYEQISKSHNLSMEYLKNNIVVKTS